MEQQENRWPIGVIVWLMVAMGCVYTAEKDNGSGIMLSNEKIFSSQDFKTKSPPLRVWSKQSTSYYTLMPSKAASLGEAKKDLRRYDVVRIDLLSDKQDIVVEAQALVESGSSKSLEIDGLQFSDDEKKVLIYTNSQQVWRQKTRGDYWVFDLNTKVLSKVGGDTAPATLMFAKFSPAGTAVAYVQAHNIYQQNLRDNHITALTNDGTATCINGTGDWVNEEELAIRDGFCWSPDGQSIAFWQFDTASVPRFHLIDNTAELYPRITSFAYPKVGQTNSAVRIGVVSVSGGEVRWLAIPGDPRQHYVSAIGWMPDNASVMLQQLNRLQNTNRVFLANARNGGVQLLMTEQDAAWVETNSRTSLLRNGQAFLWMSERDGWDHIYVINRDGSPAKLITPGDYDVLAIEAIDSVNNWVYFSASPDNPTQRYLYRVHVDGGPAQRLSPMSQPGWHTYSMSRDAQWAIHSYSTFSTPPVVSVIKLSDHRVAHVLPDQMMLQEKVGTLAKPQSSFFKIAINDEVTLDGWRICPPNFDPKRTYPVLFYVYGEPAGQSVRDSWGGSSGLWHWMLAQRGYIVISVDPRGTNVPRGRAWRKCIYRQIGMIAPEDIAAATRALVKKWEFIDPKRIGVWGWSGGGSNTLHAIFRFPDLFSTAIAVAPNANQLLYDTIYQERYMGLPDDNAEGYRRGSPITYAAQLRGNLLLVHGTGDDNGHFQGTEQLMNSLIAHNKHFTVMPYPARSHAISEGENTTPHFYDLMTRYLDEHLMPEPQGK